MKFLGPPSSGSRAAETFARNRGGQYIRARNGRGGTGDTTFGTLAGLWQSTLTDAQRFAWNLFAAERSVTGKLGQTVQLSGWQWFCKVNRSLLTIGPGLQADPPDGIAGSPPVSPCVLVDVTFTLTQAHMHVESRTPASLTFVVDSTGIVSSGTMSAPGRGHYWSELFVCSGTAVASPTDFSTGTSWFLKYGAAPTSGQVVFFGIRCLDVLKFWQRRQVFRFVAP